MALGQGAWGSLSGNQPGTRPCGGEGARGRGSERPGRAAFPAAGAACAKALGWECACGFEAPRGDRCA